MLALGSSAGLLGLFGALEANAATYETSNYQKGLAPVKIKRVRASVTAHKGFNLVVVKVETTEPDL